MRAYDTRLTYVPPPLVLAPRSYWPMSAGHFGSESSSAGCLASGERLSTKARHRMVSHVPWGLSCGSFCVATFFEVDAELAMCAVAVAALEVVVVGVQVRTSRAGVIIRSGCSDWLAGMSRHDPPAPMWCGGSSLSRSPSSLQTLPARRCGRPRHSYPQPCRSCAHTSRAHPHCDAPSLRHAWPSAYPLYSLSPPECTRPHPGCRASMWPSRCRTRRPTLRQRDRRM